MNPKITFATTVRVLTQLRRERGLTSGGDYRLPLINLGIKIPGNYFDPSNPL